MNCPICKSEVEIVQKSTTFRLECPFCANMYTKDYPYSDPNSEIDAWEEWRELCEETNK